MGTLRLFVAFSIPSAVLEAVEAALTPVRARLAEARWLPRASWHVTLKFLGPTPEEALPAISAVLAGVAAGSDPVIRSRLTTLGAFPSARRARVIWVGLEDPGGQLAGLARALEGALEPLGFPAEPRPWRAHLSIARLRPPASAGLGVGLEVGPAGPALALAGPLPAEPFAVDEMVLFQSHLGRGGATYQPLLRCPLGTRHNSAR